MITLMTRMPRLWLCVLAALLLLPGTMFMPLLDRDEPRFSRATVEMIERNEWVIPYFNNQYRFDKPPLTYWWMSAHFALFGQSEFSARLHAVIATLLIALVIDSIGRALDFSPRQAFCSAVIWLTSLQVAIHGRIAVADMPLILGICLMMRALIAYRDPLRTPKAFSGWFWLFYLSLAMGFLAKGPLAFIIPALALLLHALLQLRMPAWTAASRRLAVEFVPGVLLATMVVAIWGIPALLRTHNAYFDSGIGEHVIKRGTEVFNKRTFIPGVYFLLIWVFFLPWAGFLPQMWRDAWSRREGWQGLLLGWGLASFLVFAFYRTQLPHYVLPSYPALALLLGYHLGDRTRCSMWRPVPGFGGVASALFLIAAAAVGILAWQLSQHAPFRALAVGSGYFSAFLVLFAIAIWQASHKRWLRATVLLMACSGVLAPATYHLRQAHMSVRLAAHPAVQQSNHPAALFYHEPSLVWYSRRFWDFMTSAQWSQQTSLKNDLLICTARSWRIDGNTLRQWWRGEEITPSMDRRDRLPVADQEKVEWIYGWNAATNDWLEIAIFPLKPPAAAP